MSAPNEMFAVQDGTRILSEKPLIALSYPQSVAAQKSSLARQVEALPSSARQDFLSRPNIYGAGQELADKYFGIFRTIGLPCGDDEDEASYFPHASRINHACDNNGQKSWNTKIQRHTAHALRDIEAGEEITVYYIALQNNRQARQEALQLKFGFTARRLIGRGGAQALLSRPHQILSYVDEQVRLYNEGGANDSGLARACFDAAQVCVANGDLARASFFSQRAADEAALCLGEDGDMVDVYRRMAVDPSKQGIAKMTRAWKTAISNVPEGLSDQEFDNWLWRRPEPNSRQPLQAGSFALHQPADLRNRTYFPSFSSLPRDNDINNLLDPGMRRRHWCFLGKIVGDAAIVPTRLILLVKDVDGNPVELFFYTDERGAEVDPALGSTAVGSAVALLYAEWHDFAFSPPGIRHEHPRRFKASYPPFFLFLVFPMSLEKLLSSSDLVQQFSWAKDGRSRTCHGCGQLKQSLKTCGKCGLMWYCNSKCQQRGWDERGHKEDCKLLRDRDLKEMFKLRWDEFDDFVEFPLAEVSSATAIA
ncbi:hypothetical protein QBC37DRAFT_479665 [Rhypophila decipiens]|uniref:MYND-type domain-containing protein n=1 Tax=Rhypophila decipiens TaxID=261697 RepID=A0AAN7BB39_9PEZI|nr:hypothetical protein QBC37DRAFT_479665 [Rhypophila decipiens]